jgi:hypothetical protein
MSIFFLLIASNGLIRYAQLIQVIVEKNPGSSPTLTIDKNEILRLIL